MDGPGGHIVHIPGNNPLANKVGALNKEIMANFHALTESFFAKLASFSQENIKAIGKIEK